MKVKILVISPMVPYDKVGHAGGKIHNYYLKRFNADEEFDIKLITFAKYSERNNIDLDYYNIDNKVFYHGKNIYYKIRVLLRYNIGQVFNPFDKNGGFVDYYMKAKIKKYLLNLKEDGYEPDIIILTWTQIALLISDIKVIYPLCKYIAVEHDVSYQSLFRKYMYEKNIIKKIFKLCSYNSLKKAEIGALGNFDLVLTFNRKDVDLLTKDNINKNTTLNHITPYFTSMSSVNPKYCKNNIVFFGAMWRQENYESCIWFLENVFIKLQEKDRSLKFFIIGGNPNKKLYKYSSENVIITGFVDDVTEYFKSSLCMVAPLLYGAGIKIKVLEGMSAGLPVLTNDVGIEGIEAEDNDFIYCKDADDYIDNILKLKNDTKIARQIGNNAKAFIFENFDINKSYEKYKKMLLNLIINSRN